jgi:serine/threonine protein kinase
MATGSVIGNGNYVILDFLGAGSFGHAYKVRCLRDIVGAPTASGPTTLRAGDKYAAKVININLHTRQDHVNREVNLQSSCVHPNITGYIAHELEFEEQQLDRVILITELATGGSLEKKIGRVTEQAVLRIVAELGQALHYLHGLDIVHR